mmetsp:Transcript_86927/g.223805  ORF Transcript_86927/g.223805 Transcript_86927/m.223805 type:complete len:234 (-) Transcript_86927:1054-1755(-)
MPMPVNCSKGPSTKPAKGSCSRSSGRRCSHGRHSVSRASIIGSLRISSSRCRAAIQSLSSRRARSRFLFCSRDSQEEFTASQRRIPASACSKAVSAAEIRLSTMVRCSRVMVGALSSSSPSTCVGSCTSEKTSMNRTVRKWRGSEDSSLGEATQCSSSKKQISNGYTAKVMGWWYGEISMPVSVRVAQLRAMHATIAGAMPAAARSRFPQQGSPWMSRMVMAVARTWNERVNA